MQLNNKIYLHELREVFLQKLVDDWPQNYESELGEFASFEALKSKNAFIERVLEEIETVLRKKLNGQSSKYLFSKDFLRRFIFEYGGKEVRIQSHSRSAIAIF